MNKLEIKLMAIEDRFKEYFIKYNITYVIDPLGTPVGQRAELKKAISRLLSHKDLSKKEEFRLKSTIYSYDLADNDYYKGIMQVETFLKEQQAKDLKKVVVNWYAFTHC